MAYAPLSRLAGTGTIRGAQALRPYRNFVVEPVQQIIIPKSCSAKKPNPLAPFPAREGGTRRICLTHILHLAVETAATQTRTRLRGLPKS
jgi:hypothetical protein